MPWDALPTTGDADLLAGFSAWRPAHARLAKSPVWGEPCASATTVAADPTVVHAFLQGRMQVYSLRSSSNGDQGLITGYYEPVYHGSLSQGEKIPVPVYSVPDDLVVVTLESVYPELEGKRLRRRLEGRVLKPCDDTATIRDNGSSAPALAWLDDPMDLQLLQIQGSGHVQLEDGRQLHISYGDQNGHPYKPVGRWPVKQGLVPKEEISMKRIRDWAEVNPQRVSELLASNPSFVFFSLRLDGDVGPRGLLNVPLTDGYSVAIGRKMIPLGSLMWLSTTRPDDGSTVVRPVVAQDTGGAIVGEVRADLFWGTGNAAGELVRHMKQPGRLWPLWPKGAPLLASWRPPTGAYTPGRDGWPTQCQRALDTTDRHRRRRVRLRQQPFKR